MLHARTNPEKLTHFIEGPTEARCRCEASKPTYGVVALFNATVILLQSIVEILVTSMENVIAKDLADCTWVRSEFSGISYLPNPGTPWFGYGTVTNSDDFLSRYRELVDAILESPAIAGFCYTQLTDTEQETHGLLTSNREPKLDPAAIRAITRRSSAAVPVDVIGQMQKVQDITAFVGLTIDSTAKASSRADE